jgi:hypothetical protein
MKKIEITYDVDENGCWNCTSHTPNTSGYFDIKRDGMRWKLHRYMYTQVHGAIPDGLVLRHTCDNRKCINPNHLIPGTHADNVSDMVERDRNAKGIVNGRTKLSEEDVLEIYNDNISTHQELADRYGVVRSTIQCIKYNQTWTHITSQDGV